MSVAVKRFEDDDRGALERLNARLEAAECEHRVYPEDLSGNPEADLEIRPINHALYVVADEDEIRGGAWLREQYFWVDGSRHRVGWMKYPVSESLIDPRFAGVPASMIMQFIRQQPYLMALGMGGHGAPFARLLAGIGWKSSSIPFLFRVARPFRVLRNLAYARRRPWMRVAMDVGAWSGLGWLANRLFRVGVGHQASGAETTGVVEERFTPWADEVWETCRDDYHALAVRDGRTLDHLYPASFRRLHRLRVSRSGHDVGWVAAQMFGAGQFGAQYFGELKVGLMTDALARPGDARTVLAAGAEHLEGLGADLVITYLCHEDWVRAAKNLRFLSGPSTFAFYRSPQADELLAPEGGISRCHLTRSDGDGPAG